jgi:hypothetical protein
MCHWIGGFQLAAQLTLRLCLWRQREDAFCVVSDSGTLPEESSFYLSVGRPIPAVCIRTSTERPEALDKGCFVLSGIDEVGLLQSVDLAVEMVRNGDLGVPVPDYVDENVSDKVVRIVQSYVGVVNKMVWRKGYSLPAYSDIAERVLVRMGWHYIAIVDLNGRRNVNNRSSFVLLTL